MSIRHVVSWRLATTDAAEREEHAARIVAGLESLVGVVDEIRSLTAGTDVAGGDNWDVVLIADFDDMDAVARYQAHPEHQKVGAYIRSVAQSRMAVDLNF
ncbi:MAG TPA: Dabb family protein [Demequina sp.]|nr:Dabb family protein [Demequina sp.]